MQKSKGQGHAQPDTPPTGTPSVRVTWHVRTPSPGQQLAWLRLWQWLLDKDGPGPETQQPQEDTPGAGNVAAVVSGSHIVSEYANNTTHCPLST